MKKILTLSVLLLVMVALVGCGNDEGEPTTQTDNAEAIATAMESIAGVWNWPGNFGNAIFINTDGTWEHSLGDMGVRGNVVIRAEADNFAVELTASEGHGPGAWGMQPPPTENDGWIVLPNPQDYSFSAMYNISADSLNVRSRNDGSFLEMERANAETEVIFDGRTFVELSSIDSIIVPMAEFDNYRLHTNSTQISVSVPYSEHSGTIVLRDAVNNQEIQRFTLDQSNRMGVFTNLTSAMNYLLVASGFGRDDTTIFVISN